jgi:NAD(P)-dependent dehydrogenase (short-subunit alcohol dehydrogenase family)
LSRSVTGKVVIVTNAASGMGRATAHLFADEGALVAATDITLIEGLVGEIFGKGGNAHGWSLDVSRIDDIYRVAAEIAAHFGGIDMLINNAGVLLHVAVDTEDFESRRARSLDVLLTAPVQMFREPLPRLRRVGGARIVNIASTGSWGLRVVDNKAVLRLVRRYLAAVIMEGGMASWSGTRERLRAGHCRRCWPMCCLIKSIGIWNSAGTGSFVTPMIATFTFAVSEPANECWKACAKPMLDSTSK